MLDKRLVVVNAAELGLKVAEGKKTRKGKACLGDFEGLRALGARGVAEGLGTG